MRRSMLLLTAIVTMVIVAAGVALAAALVGTKWNDLLNGTEFQDRIVGAQGNDTINGKFEADQLYGDNGDDTIGGQKSNDYLEGGRGWDNMNGEEGNDYLNAVDGIGGNDRKVDGGEPADATDTDEDTCVIDAGDSVRIKGTTTYQAIADQDAADAVGNSTCENIYVVPVPPAAAAALAAGTD